MPKQAGTSSGNQRFQGFGLHPDVARRLDDLSRTAQAAQTRAEAAHGALTTASGEWQKALDAALKRIASLEQRSVK